MPRQRFLMLEIRSLAGNRLLWTDLADEVSHAMNDWEEGAGSASGDRSGPGIILLVDDEEDILPEYQELLELRGYATMAQSNPLLAYDTVLATPAIMLVISDLRMAGMDGASLVRKLRENLPDDRKVDFIILTGDEEAREGDMGLGVPILHKPVETDALVSLIASSFAGNP